MLSRKEFEELIASDQVQNVTVIQNKNVPTGRVEIELKAEEGERGEVKNYYVSDVNQIQEDLAEWDVDYELPNAPQDNWFTTTILPVFHDEPSGRRSECQGHELWKEPCEA